MNLTDILTDRKKGQGSVATIFLFFLAIMFTFFMVILTSQMGVFSQEVDVEVDRKMADVFRQALISTSMNDHLWRADSIDRGKYDNKLAKEVVSYYYSTPGDTLYFDQNSVPKSEVYQDLQDYFTYKMQSNLVHSASASSYLFRIEYEGTAIEAREEDFNEGVNLRGPTTELGLSNGEVAKVTLMTKNPQVNENVPGRGSVPER